MNKPCLRTTEEICAHLDAHDYFGNKVISDRLKQGSLQVNCGHDKWPDHYSENAWENMSWPLVFKLVVAVPNIETVKLYYDPKEDFHHIEFPLDGKTFDVRWYKIYAMTCKDDGRNVTFHLNEDAVVRFFTSGNYKKEKWG